jgi:hypothetical protein
MRAGRNRDGLGQSFPRDPLPSGWRQLKFRTLAPMTMFFGVKGGVPSIHFETHDSASMLFRSVEIDLAAYRMLAWRWYIGCLSAAARRAQARRRRSPGATVSSVPQGRESRTMN